MRLLIGLIVLILAGCVNPPAIETPIPTAIVLPTPVVQPSPTLEPSPEPTTPAPGDWSAFVPGADLLETTDGLVAFRHKPSAVNYSADFQPNPDNSRMISRWLAEDSTAFAAVNCGFYWKDENDFHHIGLLTTNGEVLSNIRSRWGGVLIVRDGVAFMVRRPKSLLSPATMGIQGWPVLLENRTIISGLNNDDVARRTAVGVDEEGRVIWVVAQRELTLNQFAIRLLEADLGLVDAVNLDGGISAGLRWRPNSGDIQHGADSLPVPCAVRFSPP